MKKGCGCALLIGLVLLALLAWQPWNQAKTPVPSVPTNPTLAPATSRAALERIRPHVFHRPYNASEEEVTTETTAGKGDRVRTPSNGKPLLKWPDLHVLIYGGMDLKVEYDNPTSMNLTQLGARRLPGSSRAPGTAWRWLTTTR